MSTITYFILTLAFYSLVLTLLTGLDRRSDHAHSTMQKTLDEIKYLVLRSTQDGGKERHDQPPHSLEDRQE